MWRGVGNTQDENLKTLAWHKDTVRKCQEISLKIAQGHVGKFLSRRFKEFGLDSRVLEWTNESRQTGSHRKK